MQCQSSAQCAGSQSGAICNLANEACVQCLSWSDCGYLTSGCFGGICGACGSSQNCAPNQTCAPGTFPFQTQNTCVCEGNSGCGGDAPVCVTPGGGQFGSSSSQSGCGCNGPGQCPSGEICQLSTNQCQPSCVGNAALCAGTSTPVCDTASGQCVQCAASNDCANVAGAPYCLVSQNVCVQCLSASDCPSTAPVCTAANVCDCAVPSGSYTATCSGCSVSSCELTCTCNGNAAPTGVALPCAAGVVDCAGTLACGSCGSTIPVGNTCAACTQDSACGNANVACVTDPTSGNFFCAPGCNTGTCSPNYTCGVQTDSDGVNSVQVCYPTSGTCG